MTWSRGKIYGLVALAIVALAVRVPAQGRFDAVVMRAIPAGEGVTMLMGAGGNIGVCSGADGVLLIDDQFAELAPKVKAAVDSISGGKPIRFVFNTHWHGDHTGGNAILGQQGVAIVAQDNVRRRMSRVQIRATFNDTVQASPAAALPIVTFTDSMAFHLNGDDLQVFHVANAHTDGDAIVRFTRTNTIHMGDTFFNGLYPVIDVSTGGSIGGMIAADDLALTVIDANTKVIPGHGPLGDRAQLVAFRDMLVTVRNRMKKLVAQKKTLEQVLAAKPTADLDATWGKNSRSSDRFLTAVYADLSRGGRAHSR